MAASCSNVVVRGGTGTICSTLPPNGRPQISPSALSPCCFSQLSLRRPSKSISHCPRSTVEYRAPRSSRSWGQQGLQRRSESRSLASCLPTDVSSDAASPELGTAEGGESGMSIEEKNAILRFEEGLSPDGSTEESESEMSTGEKDSILGFEDGSSPDEKSASGEEEPENLEAVPKSESVGEVKRVRGRGAPIANVMTLFMTLLDRPPTGDGRLLAGAGSAVLERVEEEVGKLQAVEGVDGQLLFEIMRVVKLLRMDFQLIAAARKNSTLVERQGQAKDHCRQMLNILSML